MRLGTDGVREPNQANQLEGEVVLLVGERAQAKPRARDAEDALGTTLATAARGIAGALDRLPFADAGELLIVAGTVLIATI